MILQPKADHQGSNILFTDFRWTGTYIVAKVLPNNTHLIGKVETDRTQVLYCKRLRPFTPNQPILDVELTSQNGNLTLRSS